jgi:hypothetical protein
MGVLVAGIGISRFLRRLWQSQNVGGGVVVETVEMKMKLDVKCLMCAVAVVVPAEERRGDD